MPGKTLLASLSGVATGIALTTVAASDSISTDDLRSVALLSAALVLPMTVLTLVALATLKRWIRANEKQIKWETSLQAEQRQAMEQEFARRSTGLTRREDRLNCLSESNQAQSSLFAEHLVKARAERDAALKRAEETEHDYEVLAHEYNGLVLGEVRQRAAQFTRPGRQPSPGQERRREQSSGDPVLVPRIGRQLEPEHHSRPAEG